MLCKLKPKLTLSLPRQYSAVAIERKCQMLLTMDFIELHSLEYRQDKRLSEILFQLYSKYMIMSIAKRKRQLFRKLELLALLIIGIFKMEDYVTISATWRLRMK